MAQLCMVTSSRRSQSSHYQIARDSFVLKEIHERSADLEESALHVVASLTKRLFNAAFHAVLITVVIRVFRLGFVGLLIDNCSLIASTKKSLGPRNAAVVGADVNCSRLVRRPVYATQ